MERERCHYCRRLVYPRSTAPAPVDPTPAQTRRYLQTQTRDHVLSASSGERSDDPENIVVACLACNQTKGDAPYEVFLYWLQHVPAAKRHDTAAFGRFRYSLTLAGFKNLLRHGTLPLVDAPAVLARVARRVSPRRRKPVVAAPVSETGVATTRAPYTLRDLTRRER